MLNIYERKLRPYTYIAADWDGDNNAVQTLKAWNADCRKSLSFKDAHDLVQARDSSLNCSIKTSLSSRIDESYVFILIVGDKTNTLRSGACHLCPSYNSFIKYCTRGRSVDYRRYIDFECEKAVRDGLQIIVLYNSHAIDKSKCPEAVKTVGTHKEMWAWDGNKFIWDYNKISTAMGSY